MVMMTLEKVPEGLRGELTRWMIEITTGVFVGDLSAIVRDLLWEKCTERLLGGRCWMAYNTNNEQGFALRTAGDKKRDTIDLDGLTLVAVRNARWEELMSEQAERETKRLARLAYLDNSNPVTVAVDMIDPEA